MGVHEKIDSLVHGRLDFRIGRSITVYYYLRDGTSRWCRIDKMLFFMSIRRSAEFLNIRVSFCRMYSTEVLYNDNPEIKNSAEIGDLAVALHAMYDTVHRALINRYTHS